ncbi:MAG TPA: hypothetical protein VGT81_01735 [Casimicrobiaceae bacterium]|nr:hypothetical protein [Casimicrobiaceae bacterium]
MRENNIPLEGRIASICDVYDALREHRVYRRGLTHAQAMNIILQGACCEIAGVRVMDGRQEGRSTQRAASGGSLRTFRGAFSGVFRAADRLPV